MSSREDPEIVSRTFAFGVRVVKLCSYLFETKTPFGLIDQLARSATSIGANVEEAQAAQSKSDFISKMSIATKEARETHFRLRVLVAAELISPKRANGLCEEADEIRRILGAIVASAANRRRP